MIDEDEHQHAAICEEYFSDPESSPELIDAALFSFGVSLAYNSSTQINDFDEVFGIHLELLGSDELTVRLSAGINIALFFECNPNLKYHGKGEIMSELEFLAKGAIH